MYDYHDARLKSATLDWESGITTIVFALCAEPAREVAITVQETTDLNFKRQFPWGKSVSVDRLRIQRFNSGYRLELEMQSGDKIVVLGEEVSEKTPD